MGIILLKSLTMQAIYPSDVKLCGHKTKCGKGPGLNWTLPPNTCVDNRLGGKTIYTTDYIDHNAPTRRTKYEKMDYPHGWSFWSRDEWKALKDRRTDNYAKLKVKARGSLTGTTADEEIDT